MLIAPNTGTRIIGENERFINDTLIELACHPSSFYRRTALIDILEEIADFRFGDPPYPRASGFYSGPLYWDIFGPDPANNLAYRIARLRQRFQHTWITRDLNTMVVALREFYSDFGYGCETGDLDRMKIGALVDGFIAKVA